MQISAFPLDTRLVRVISWKVDPLHSFAHGQSLRKVCGEIDLVGSAAHSAVDERFDRAWADFVFTAICHATNWDKLRSRVHSSILHSGACLKRANYLRELDGDGFAVLTGMSSDTEDGQSRLNQLRRLGEWAVTIKFEDTLRDWVRDGASLAGPAGLYNRLGQAPAFGADPLEKKMRVLAHQFHMAGTVQFSDETNLRPAIDYHLIRLYMRTNRISPSRFTQLEDFRTGAGVTSRHLTRIREAVEAAMYYTADGAGASIPVLNHVEWQIGRSHCTRKEARCWQPALVDKPMDRPLDDLARRQGGCPFVNVCRGHQNELTLAALEPESKDSFY